LHLPPRYWLRRSRLRPTLFPPVGRDGHFSVLANFSGTAFRLTSLGGRISFFFFFCPSRDIVVPPPFAQFSSSFSPPIIPFPSGLHLATRQECSVKLLFFFLSVRTIISFPITGFLFASPPCRFLLPVQISVFSFSSTTKSLSPPGDLTQAQSQPLPLRPNACSRFARARGNNHFPFFAERTAVPFFFYFPFVPPQAITSGRLGPVQDTLFILPFFPNL